MGHGLPHGFYDFVGLHEMFLDFIVYRGKLRIIYQGKSTLVNGEAMANGEMKLGKVQLEIMKVLWDRGEATARQITDVLARREEIAHSTVQTLLRKLEAKGAVEHVNDGRTFIFRPLIRQSSVAASTTHDLLIRVFQGSVYSLVAHLIKHETVSPEELHRLRELIDSSSEEGGAK